ncbi:flagellar protein FlhE [Salinisphaera hydrothermalis]|uniref:Flagellar protein flhE n=1 Tax=Salinisphaera hydrothermalis (strain C41B8) TaxID=1304275 RepID=A0A084IMV5_SALHC|nr:flagellar protein FlhE [Salinisphaera hydrothermalis]KEZ78039.1 flagellar protein flhE [Salinisphaera hydrothermalis C41B8]
MKRRVAFAVSLALAACAGTASAAGSWIAEAALPAIGQRGRVYVSPRLAPRPTTPVTGHGIGRVQWRYGYDRVGDPRMVARLCAAGRCVDASNPRGGSKAFAGLPVVTPFHLMLKVPGSGRVAPAMRVGRVQLVVNFE